MEYLLTIHSKVSKNWTCKFLKNVFFFRSSHSNHAIQTTTTTTTIFIYFSYFMISYSPWIVIYNANSIQCYVTNILNSKRFSLMPMSDFRPKSKCLLLLFYYSYKPTDKLDRIFFFFNGIRQKKTSHKAIY